MTDAQFAATEDHLMSRITLFWT